jgi:hypothetical protein
MPGVLEQRRVAVGLMLYVLNRIQHVDCGIKWLKRLWRRRCPSCHTHRPLPITTTTPHCATAFVLAATMALALVSPAAAAAATVAAAAVTVVAVAAAVTVAAMAAATWRWRRVSWPLQRRRVCAGARSVCRWQRPPGRRQRGARPPAERTRDGRAGAFLRLLLVRSSL